MTIQEAIKTDRRIRRPCFNGYCTSNGANLVWDSGVPKFTCIEDILANDWEVEEEKFEVTETELHKAFKDLKTNPDGYRWLEISKKLREGKYR